MNPVNPFFNPEILSRLVPNDGSHCRTITSGPIPHRNLACVLLRTFGGPRVHNRFLHRESCFLGLVDSLVASLRIAVA